MVKLSDKQIEEFRKIYKNKFGEDISKQEACEQGTRLVEFFELLIKLDKKAEIAGKND